MGRFSVPAVGDSPEAHADWVELQALLKFERRASWSDHRCDLKKGGSVDSTESEYPESEQLEQVLEDVADEIEGRERDCGGNYPFCVEEGGLSYLGWSMAYEFMLLLSYFGHRAGPAETYPERIFEDLCCHALHAYLGSPGASKLTSYVFGSPRSNSFDSSFRTLPSGFEDAVDELCRKLGEGAGCRSQPKVEHQKDAKLDLISWRGFPDCREGQIIVFGQCATGRDWTQKVSELIPDAWCKQWMRDCPAVSPAGAYFVPHRMRREDWLWASRRGGIVFDRCRISWLVPQLSIDENLKEGVCKWVQYVRRRSEINEKK